MRLIDADALAVKLKRLQSQVSSTSAMEIAEYIDRINAQPTIEAAPVVHGRWIGFHGYYECSLCGSEMGTRDGWNYCPNCGARMDKED